MKIDAVINISARHVHLTHDAIDKLFGHDLTLRNKLLQPGQFASEETVTICTSNGEFNNVRVIGPARSYNQVEIAKSDARKLGINPPVRTSGDLDGSERITIKTDRGEITGNFCIIADRHVHMSYEEAKNLGIKDKEKLKLVIDGEKPGVIEIKAKLGENSPLEVHLDTDDANAFLIDSSQKGIILK